jgi:hypothetical protein
MTRMIDPTGFTPPTDPAVGPTRSSSTFCFASHSTLVWFINIEKR